MDEEFFPSGRLRRAVSSVDLDWQASLATASSGYVDTRDDVQSRYSAIVDPRLKPWMVHRLRRIDLECFGQSKAWTEDRFLRHNVFVEHKLDLLVGFIAFGYREGNLYIHKIAVDAKCRRDGYGSRLLARVEGIADWHNIKQACVSVDERNLSAQLFFKSHGYKCDSISGGCYNFRKTSCGLTGVR